MTSLCRRILSCVSLLVLAGSLANCGGGGGGGGGNGFRLYFGINNDGACKALVIDVGLSDAHAILEHQDDGSLDCVLNSVLDNGGCNATFDLVDNGHTLRASVSGCTIPAVSSVFSCIFRDADISELQEDTAAICTCQTSGCDTSPPVCISEDASPTSCEDCDNHVDDDGNGLVDCQDPNCEHSEDCGGGPETTTTTIEGQTTTTVSVPTTTLVPTDTCTLTFRLKTAVTASSLAWKTDYHAAPGAMHGVGDDVECIGLIDGGLAVFTDDDAHKTLTSGIISVSGFTGPVDIAQCSFETAQQIQKSDFEITVTEASDPNVDPIIPLPKVIVTSIECVPVTTTTTAEGGGGTTTTVEGGGGTTTTVEGGGTTTTIEIGTTTTTTLPIIPGAYDVTFRMTAATNPVNALQFHVNYNAAPGNFEGSGGAVTCTSSIPDSFFAPNDNDGTRVLTLGLITLNGVAEGADIGTCRFVANSVDDLPLASQFVVTIDDATDSNGGEVTATISPVIAPARGL